METSRAVVESGSGILDELYAGEPINWGAVTARTVGGGAKGAMFSVPGLGTAELAAGTVGIATAENYLHSAAKGDVSAEALGKALANGTIEGVTAGLVDVAAKKVLGAQTHAAESRPKPDLQMEPMTEAELEANWSGASDLKLISSESGSGFVIHNDVLDSPKVGSALKVDDVSLIYKINEKTGKLQTVKEFPAAAQAHGFNDIIDNYAEYATKTSLNNATLYQLEGSLNGVSGRFEWIIQDGQVTHRMFIKNGIMNGVPIKP